MSTLSTDRTTHLVRGDSLKAIRLAGSLGGRSFAFTSNDSYAGHGDAVEVSDRAFFGRMPNDAVEDQAAVVNGVNLARLRNNVAAVLIASTAMINCEPVTALELPEVHQSARESVIPVKQQDVENFLDPLDFHWDQEKYIVSEAIRSYMAQFDADH